MSTYIQSTGGISIQQAFLAFHTANPIVFLSIVQEADKKIREGDKKFSVKQIVNDLRWTKKFVTKETTLFEVEGQIRKFRIGDQYISRYSRLLITQYPHMKDYIEMRRIRSL